MKYQLYGLHVSSDIELPLPEFPSGHSQQPDVYFVLKSHEEVPENRTLQWRTIADRKFDDRYRVTIYRDGNSYLLRSHKIVDCYINEDGRYVFCCPEPEAPIEHIYNFFLIYVLFFLLYKRGVICLHGSAVALQSHAIVFLAFLGGGKSTLALSFVKQGHALLTDDALSLAEREGRIYAVPSFPAVRMWPDAADCLLGRHVQIPKIVPEMEKRWVRLDHLGWDFCSSLLPLGAIYVLDPKEPEGQDDTGIAISPLSLREAMMALITHTYGGSMLQSEMRVEQLNLYARLVSHVPVSRIGFPRGLQRLADVRCAVMQDVYDLGTRTALTIS